MKTFLCLTLARVLLTPLFACDVPADAASIIMHASNAKNKTYDIAAIHLSQPAKAKLKQPSNDDETREYCAVAFNGPMRTKGGEPLFGIQVGVALFEQDGKLCKTVSPNEVTWTNGAPEYLH